MEVSTNTVLCLQRPSYDDDHHRNSLSLNIQKFLFQSQMEARATQIRDNEKFPAELRIWRESAFGSNLYGQFK